MSVSVVITNLTAANLTINELYTTLGPAGASNAAVTISRSVAQLDSMNETKTLLNAGSISVVPTESADNADLISIPLEQHGVKTGLSVNATGLVTSAVTFAKAFPVGTTPVVTGTVDLNGTTARATLYISSITNTGFTIDLDVTTLQAGQTVKVNWVATY